MQQEPLRPELAAVEAALRSLVPRAGLDRDRLMYLAGQAAGLNAARRRPAAWLWPCATAASLVLAAVLGLRGVASRETARAPSEVASATVPADRQEPGDANEYFRLRQVVLAGGVEALPEPSVPSGEDARQPLRPLDRKHLESLLGG
jgi:hypothetical protein